jgi:hypothetical protein
MSLKVTAHITKEPQEEEEEEEETLSSDTDTVA